MTEEEQAVIFVYKMMQEINSSRGAARILTPLFGINIWMNRKSLIELIQELDDKYTMGFKVTELE